MQIFIHLVTSGMTSQEVWMFATGKLGNKLNQIFCDLTGYMIYISGYKLWSDFIYAAMKTKNPILVVLFRPDLAVNFVM